MKELDEETAREPIQDALYATGHYMEYECTEIAEHIVKYFKTQGYSICKK